MRALGDIIVCLRGTTSVHLGCTVHWGNIISALGEYHQCIGGGSIMSAFGDIRICVWDIKSAFELFHNNTKIPSMN